MGKICIDTGTKFNIKEGKTYKVRCLYSAPSLENEFEAILQIYDDRINKIEHIINKFQVGAEEFIKFKEKVMCGRDYIDFTEDLCNVVGEHTCGQCKFNIIDGYPKINLDDIELFKFVPRRRVQHDVSGDNEVLSPNCLDKNKFYKFFISNATIKDNNITLEYLIHVHKEKKQICYVTETYDMDSNEFKEIISVFVHSNINILVVSVDDINYHGNACFYYSNGNWHININSIKNSDYYNDMLNMAITVELVENAVINEGDDHVYFNDLKPFMV